MKPRNLVLIKSGNSIVVNRSTEGEIDSTIPANIIEYVKGRWRSEYRPLEAELLAMDRRSDMKAWTAKANQVTDLVQDIKNEANRMLS